MFKIILALCAAIIICIGYHTFTFFEKPVFHGKHDPNITQGKPHILLTCLATGIGGAEEHFLKLVQMLQKNFYPTTVLVAHNSPISKHLTEQNVAHYTTYATIFRKNIRYLHHHLLKKCIEKIYQKHNYDIIQCNDFTEVNAAKSIAQEHPIRVIATRHVPDPLNTEKLRDLYAIVGVNPRIANYFEQENKARKLNIKHICSIPPLYNQERCLRYQSSATRQSFYHDEFNITITDAPIISMIANFYRDLIHKNHKLLVAALDELINKEHRQIQVMLAGDGPSRKLIENMIAEKNLTPFVHFLGYINQIPGLLHHSDIMVLTSKKEATPIAYLEAGIMKKPAIGAYETGAETVIVHEQTGLLFKNNDCADLVACIKRLLDNPVFAEQLGKNARQHILENFSPEILFTQYEELYLGEWRKF